MSIKCLPKSTIQMIAYSLLIIKTKIPHIVSNYLIYQTKLNALSLNIDRSFRKLSLKFHPDKNPACRELAEEVQKQLGLMRTHLLTGEPLEIASSTLSTKNVSLFSLLEEMEECILSGSDCTSVLHMFDKQIQTNSNPGYCLRASTPSLFYTPLRLAMMSKNVLLFTKWYKLNPDMLLYTTEEGVVLSPWHALIRASLEEKEEKIYQEMLSVIGQEKNIEACIWTLNHLKQPARGILQYCVDYLHKHQNSFDAAQLMNANPFVVQSSLGDGLFETENKKHEFILKQISNYPALYYYLNDTQKCDLAAILPCICYCLNYPDNNIISLSEIARNLNKLVYQKTPISPYVMCALLEHVSKISDNPLFNRKISLASLQNKRCGTYLSLNRTYQYVLVIAATLCAIAASFTPVALIGAVVILGLLAQVIHSEYKKHQASKEITRILEKNNFFKPVPVPDASNDILAADDFNSSTIALTPM